MPDVTPLTAAQLPTGITARHIENGNGLLMHVLEANQTPQNAPSKPGSTATSKGTLLLLHGFPELAYSWRKIMPVLADAGYHVIAPDLRGYGRTTGGDNTYSADLAQFRILNLVRDVTGLLSAMGYRHVDAVIGHDFGSPLAAACALVRPDVYRALVCMSAPFAGAPAWPAPSVAAAHSTTQAAPPLTAMTGLSDPGLDVALARLTPPRKHYQWYYSTPDANADMLHPPQGLHAFLRAYYHMKSADWPENKPRPLPAWSAEALAALPTYYVMNHADGMAATVAPHLPSSDAIANNTWLPDADLSLYAAEYARTTFQGGLNWYRCVTGGLFAADLKTYAGRTIDVPACFISGSSDWGIHQKPGDLEAMQTKACKMYLGTHLIDGAGHWVQQEQPLATIGALSGFLHDIASTAQA